ncbi:N-6 DNA methylase [Pectobacterium carotovorum]|nr:N-6 DNA methylase [Pectobacterium carotovorum]
MNKQQLAAKIWESANQMRSKIDANEYKDYILGFIFYKYLSDKLERYPRFGLAPKSKADYAFLLHDLYHLKPDGIMAIVLPHGVLFRGGEEGEIRKNLIENDHLNTIIGLPANIFFGTGIPTIILVLKQKRKNSDKLIVDASKGFAKEGKSNKLRACDIKKICNTVRPMDSLSAAGIIRLSVTKKPTVKQTIRAHKKTQESR